MNEKKDTKKMYDELQKEMKKTVDGIKNYPVLQEDTQNKSYEFYCYSNSTEEKGDKNNAGLAPN